MKDRELLNKREEELMYLLWERCEPLTTADIASVLNGKGWNKSTLFNTIQSLLGKRFIKVSGTELNNTQYARQFIPALTKDEYAAMLLKKKGLDMSHLANIALAMKGTDKRKGNNSADTELIAELEQIIDTLKKGTR